MKMNQSILGIIIPLVLLPMVTYGQIKIDPDLVDKSMNHGNAMGELKSASNGKMLSLITHNGINIEESLTIIISNNLEIMAANYYYSTDVDFGEVYIYDLLACELIFNKSPISDNLDDLKGLVKFRIKETSYPGPLTPVDRISSKELDKAFYFDFKNLK